MKKIGSIQQKILLLLMGGVVLGLSGDPRYFFKTLSGLTEEWEKINKQALRRAIKSLYENKLTEIKEQADGTITLVLSEDGKKRALAYKLSNMGIVRPKYWDKKWRVVVFDIPEEKKQARESIREYLRQLGFYQLQRSVFVIPFECGNEIDFLIELYGVRSNVRQFIATGIDNELHLKDIFQI